MKVVFAGPSLHGSAKIIPAEIVLLPPAMQGDVYRQAQAGADVIGIVDGVFEDCASVWHKEILYALSLGVRVYGAASMGALRAAECAEFGMIGVGQVFLSYFEGSSADDADVALSHGPRELGYVPLSMPLANVRATVAELLKDMLLSQEEAVTLIDRAAAVFFKDRTWSSVVTSAKLLPWRQKELLALLPLHYRNLKREDAEALIDAVAAVEDQRSIPPYWEFQRTGLFERFIAE